MRINATTTLRRGTCLPRPIQSFFPFRMISHFPTFSAGNVERNAQRGQACRTCRRMAWGLCSLGFQRVTPLATTVCRHGRWPRSANWVSAGVNEELDEQGARCGSLVDSRRGKSVRTRNWVESIGPVAGPRITLRATRTPEKERPIVRRSTKERVSR